MARDLEQENRILRGLVQTNPDWKCPHGMNVESIGFCPLGFPGCSCADDRIAVLCEEDGRLVRAAEARGLRRAEAFLRKAVTARINAGQPWDVVILTEDDANWCRTEAARLESDDKGAGGPH